MAMAAGPAAITLEKHLPMASGIGGGSADAAATLRALARLFGAALPDAAEILRLGADVPVCLAGRPVRMGGIGEDLTPVTGLPALPAVLVNPGVDDLLRVTGARWVDATGEPIASPREAGGERHSDGARGG